MKPERHIWDEDSTHRAVAGKEYDEVWDYAEQLEAQVELLSRKYYSALCTKCGYMRPATEIEKENEALGELLSPLVDVELERDKLEAENEALREYVTHKDDCFQARSARPWSATRQHPPCSCGLDALLTGDKSMSLSEVKEKYLPNRDIEDLRKKPETPISDVPITP